MKWIELKVIFDFKDKHLAVDLISNLFYDLNLRGVVVEEKEFEGFDDWGTDPVIPEHDAVIGYLPCDDTLKDKCKSIEEGLAKLENRTGIVSRFSYAEVNEADWAESWKAHFRPEKITDQIVVKPTWRDYSPNNKEIIIEIDPGMAFGTGTHPTTRMCITMIEKYLKRNGTFLDIGTGSGILMIAAAKLGAIKIWGTDNDHVATDTAYKNLIKNRIPESIFKIMDTDLFDEISNRFDLVTANLTTKAILILIENVKRVMVRDAVFICSGIHETDKDQVLKKMKEQGFELIEILFKDEWVSMACRSKG